MMPRKLPARHSLSFPGALFLAAACGCSRVLDFEVLAAEGRRDAGAQGTLDGSEAGAGDALRCGAVVPAPRFCDDFDGDELPFARWQETVEYNGLLRIDSTAFVSPPASLVATTRPFQADDAAEARAFGRVSFDELEDRASRFSASFDVMVDQLDPGESSWATLLRFAYESGDAFNIHELDLMPDGGVRLRLTEWAYADGGTAFEVADPDMKPFALEHWHQVRVIYEVREPHGHDNWFVLEFDGEALLTRQFADPLGGGTPTFLFGIVAISDQVFEPWKVRIDNVRIEVATL
jgi:hypothetical protein